MPRFSETLLDHATSPRNFGRLEPCNAMAQGSYNGQPPFVTFYIRVKNDCLDSVRFEAQGCGVTIAACSALSEMVTGMSRQAAQNVTLDDLIDALDGVPPDKRHSPEVAHSVFRKAILDSHSSS